jgi:CRP/FNR family transcriptional regulator
MDKVAKLLLPDNAASELSAGICADVQVRTEPFVPLIVGAPPVWRPPPFTLYRIGAGETCILSVNAILTGQPVPAAAPTEQRVEAVTIPADVLRDWVRAQELWRQFVFELISQRLIRVLNLVDDVVFRRMDARIAALLLDRSGTQNPVRITHQEIAAELGTSREVISRILEDLAGAGTLDSARGTIEILDRRPLEVLAGQ